MVDGELAHSCRHGPPPHNILVCVLKKDNPAIWASIEGLIGPRPGTKRRAEWERAQAGGGAGVRLRKAAPD
jgi:hypothetical protein